MTIAAPPRPRVETLVWALLVVATAATFAVGESGLARSLATCVVLGIAVLKGGAVALEFMELRGAPRLYRWLTLGWLVVVVALVGIAFARAGG